MKPNQSSHKYEYCSNQYGPIHAQTGATCSAHESTRISPERSRTESRHKKFVHRSTSSLAAGAVNTSGSSIGQGAPGRYGTIQMKPIVARGSVPRAGKAGRSRHDSNGLQGAPLSKRQSQQQLSSRRRLAQSLVASAGGVADPLQIPRAMHVQTLHTKRRLRKKRHNRQDEQKSSEPDFSLAAGQKYVFYSSKESSDIFPQQSFTKQVGANFGSGLRTGSNMDIQSISQRSVKEMEEAVPNVYHQHNQVQSHSVFHQAQPQAEHELSTVVQHVKAPSNLTKDVINGSIFAPPQPRTGHQEYYPLPYEALAELKLKPDEALLPKRPTAQANPHTTQLLVPKRAVKAEHLRLPKPANRNISSTKANKLSVKKSGRSSGLNNIEAPQATKTRNEAGQTSSGQYHNHQVTEPQQVWSREPRFILRKNAKGALGAEGGEGIMQNKPQRLNVPGVSPEAENRRVHTIPGATLPNIGKRKSLKRFPRAKIPVDNDFEPRRPDIPRSRPEFSTDEQAPDSHTENIMNYKGEIHKMHRRSNSVLKQVGSSFAPQQYDYQGRQPSLPGLAQNGSASRFQRVNSTGKDDAFNNHYGTGYDGGMRPLQLNPLHRDSDGRGPGTLPMYRMNRVAREQPQAQLLSMPPPAQPPHYYTIDQERALQTDEQRVLVSALDRGVSLRAAHSLAQSPYRSQFHPPSSATRRAQQAQLGLRKNSNDYSARNWAEQVPNDPAGLDPGYTASLSRGPTITPSITVYSQTLLQHPNGNQATLARGSPNAASSLSLERRMVQIEIPSKSASPSPVKAGSQAIVPVFEKSRFFDQADDQNSPGIMMKEQTISSAREASDPTAEAPHHRHLQSLPQIESAPQSHRDPAAAPTLKIINITSRQADMEGTNAKTTHIKQGEILYQYESARLEMQKSDNTDSTKNKNMHSSFAQVRDSGDPVAEEQRVELAMEKPQQVYSEMPEQKLKESNWKKVIKAYQTDNLKWSGARKRERKTPQDHQDSESKSQNQKGMGSRSSNQSAIVENVKKQEELPSIRSAQKSNSSPYEIQKEKSETQQNSWYEQKTDLKPSGISSVIESEKGQSKESNKLPSQKSMPQAEQPEYGQDTKSVRIDASPDSNLTPALIYRTVTEQTDPVEEQKPLSILRNSKKWKSQQSQNPKSEDVDSNREVPVPSDALDKSGLQSEIMNSRPVTPHGYSNNISNGDLDPQTAYGTIKVPQVSRVQLMDDYIDKRQHTSSKTPSHHNKKLNTSLQKISQGKVRTQKELVIKPVSQHRTSSGVSSRGSSFSEGSGERSSTLELKEKLEAKKRLEEHRRLEELRLAEEKRRSLIKESQRWIIKVVRQGYQYVPFKWSQDLKHEDIDLTNSDTVASNPDGQWRAVQGDLPMSNNRNNQDRRVDGINPLNSKFYVRFQVSFKPGMGMCKYFGLGPRFTTDDIHKGNRMNRKGVYFGRGNASNREGMYCSVDGCESKISDSIKLKSGDIIGMRFDAEAGDIYIDLNNKDCGLIYQSDELTEGVYFPTVDLGIGSDKVKIIQPPKNLISEIAYEDTEDLISRETLGNLKKLEQLNNTITKPESDVGQRHLFNLISHHLLQNDATSLDAVFEGLLPIASSTAPPKAIEQLLRGYHQTEILEPSVFEENPSAKYVESEATKMKAELLQAIIAIQGQISCILSVNEAIEDDCEYDILCSLVLEKLLEYPLSVDLMEEFRDQLKRRPQGESFYDEQEYMAQLKLYEVQNQLKAMDYIEFRSLLDMVRGADAGGADDKGPRALAIPSLKRPRDFLGHPKALFPHVLDRGSTWIVSKEGEYMNEHSHEYFTEVSRFTEVHGPHDAAGASNNPSRWRQPHNKKELRRQTDEDCFEITSSLMKSVQRVTLLTRERYEDDKAPKPKLLGFADFLQLLSKTSGHLAVK